MHKFPSIDQVQLLTPTGMKDGKDNILKLMKILGNPQDDLRVFHVTGSNGKGSVSQMISQTLWKYLGKKVGLFTSPHLVKINERIQINGKMISDKELDSLYEEVIKLSKKHQIELSYFEIQVVSAVLYFTRNKVDYAVFEVGLGGTYDGTNIFSHPLACFITSITLEHTKLLGKTRRSVLKNKLGIVKPGTRLYTWLDNKQIREFCQKNKIQLKDPQSPSPPFKGGEKNRTQGGVLGMGELKRGLPNKEEITNLPGLHQQKNAQLVFQSLLDLGFDKKKIIEGLRNIENPGRFQWLSPTLLVDTANNEESVQILAKMLKDNLTYEITRGSNKKNGDNSPLTRGGGGGLIRNGNITTIFGTTQEDPLYAARLAAMIPASHRILVDGFCDRALPCSTYENLVPHDEIWHFPIKNDLLNLSTGQAQGNELNVAFGSLYLIGEIMKMSMYQPFAKG